MELTLKRSKRTEMSKKEQAKLTQSVRLLLVLHQRLSALAVSTTRLALLRPLKTLSQRSESDLISKSKWNLKRALLRRWPTSRFSTMLSSTYNLFLNAEKRNHRARLPRTNEKALTRLTTNGSERRSRSGRSWRRIRST